MYLTNQDPRIPDSESRNPYPGVELITDPPDSERCNYAFRICIFRDADQDEEEDSLLVF